MKRYAHPPGGGGDVPCGQAWRYE